MVGDKMGLYTIDKEFRWEMGHRLKDHSGQCSSIHGHSYKAIVTLKAYNLDNMDMVLDFYHLKPIKQFIDEQWDHHFMISNDDPINKFLFQAGSDLYKQFRILQVESAPTAENICRWLFYKAEAVLVSVPEFAKGASNIRSVQVWETPTCSALYRYDE